MTRLSLGRAALAGGLLVWVLAQATPAQNAKPADPKAAPKADDAKPDDPKPGKPSYAAPQAQKINELIRKGYEAAGIKKPAAQANDHEYLRRVYIDLIGRIATPEEVLDFERDKSPDKRVKLVRRLLTAGDYQPRDLSGKLYTTTLKVAGEKDKKLTLSFDYTKEYAEHWSNVWTVWLMTRTGHPDYREQMHVWLEKQFIDNVSYKDFVTKLLTARGQVGGPKTDGEFKYKDSYAANFIIHHLGEQIRQEDLAREGAFDAVPITSRVTKLFLGLQTQCTQCHDHPFNKEWVQSDFWGVNAFFRQTRRSATPSGAPLRNNQKMQNVNLVTLTDDADLNPEMLVYYERRDGRRLGSFPVMLKDYAQAINGEKSAKMLASPTPGKTRRQQLSEWVVGHDNFSRAYVSRLWAHFFGRGLNKEPAADDFGSNNDIVHPELLDYLAEEFAKYGHDPKQLMEWIATSDVYQLSHVAVKEYADVKYDPYFARMPLKAMSPEVLFESLMTATQPPGKKTQSQKEARRAGRAAWMTQLVRQFGDDEGNELSFNGTIVQALLMMNGRELNDEIGGGQAQSRLIDEVMRKGKNNPDLICDELFMMTLNRHMTSADKAKIDGVLKGGATVNLGAPPATTPTPAPKGKGPAPKGPAPKGPVAKGPTPKGGGVVVPGSAPDRAFYTDVLWALLNSSEFMLNH